MRIAIVKQLTFLVFGATGATGKHFVSRALQDGHRVRALVRNLGKMAAQHPHLDVHQGSITALPDLEALVDGVDHIVAMLGDRAQQATTKVNAAFVRQLIPAMRRRGVKRLLYQAGGLSRPHGGNLSPLLWAIRHTLARGYLGQHRDNEAVMQFLAEEAGDIEWIVHRAGIGSDGASKGILRRSPTKFSVATFRDVADYNYRAVTDPAAVHTADFSHYAE